MADEKRVKHVWRLLSTPPHPHVRVRNSKVIGIVGSRRRNSASDYQKVREALLLHYKKGDTLVSGGCPSGADRFAEHLAKGFGIPIKIHHAEWRRGKHGYNRAAGFERNSLIAADADILIACVAEDRTGGTEDTIGKFLREKSKDKLTLV